MASYQIVGKSNPGNESRASSDKRKYQQNLPYLSKEHLVRSASTHQQSNRRLVESRTHVSSIEPVHLKRPPSVVIENSYQLQPVAKFPTDRVSRIGRDVLKNHLEGLEYNEAECKKLSVDICDEIQREVKSLKVPRYKYVCYVHIGQIMGQDMVIASRCLWDTEVDNFATANYKNNNLFATASVFGFYYE